MCSCFVGSREIIYSGHEGSQLDIMKHLNRKEYLQKVKNGKVWNWKDQFQGSVVGWERVGRKHCGGEILG